jgi:hypothetical protein
MVDRRSVSIFRDVMRVASEMPLARPFRRGRSGAAVQARPFRRGRLGAAVYAASTPMRRRRHLAWITTQTACLVSVKREQGHGAAPRLEAAHRLSPRKSVGCNTRVGETS